ELPRDQALQPPETVVELMNSEKSPRRFFRVTSQCEEDRQSRIPFTRGTALHVIPHGSRPAGGLELPAAKTARNSMQGGLSCGQDPALPGLAALMEPRKNRLQAIFPRAHHAAGSARTWRPQRLHPTVRRR